MVDGSRRRGYLGSYAFGTGLGTIGDWVATSWADEYQSAVEALPTTHQDRAEALRASLHELADRMREEGVYEPRDFGEQSDDVDDLIGDWRQTSGAVTGETVMDGER